MTLSNQLTSDLSQFIDDSEFAKEIIFTPGESYPNRTDKTATISGILDREFIEVNGMESLHPALLCLSSDVENAAHAIGNSMVEDGADKYKVIAKQPDGTGLTLLVLQGPQ